MQQQTSIHERGSQVPHDIEARLERDRQDVATAFSALRDRFSPDSLWQDAASFVTRNAGKHTATLEGVIRGNPMAVAMSAVGLAWLVLGRPNQGDDTPEKSTLAGTRFEAMTRWEDEGGPVTDPQMPVPAALDDWTIEADKLRSRAAVMLDQINKATRKGSASAGELAHRKAEVLSALTKDVRRALGRGLEGLSETTRNAALAAREQGYDAHLAARRKTSEVMQDRPLTSAMALAGAGAALALLLPRSTVEDRYLGRTRDQIVDELTRVFQDERQRIAASAQIATQEMMSSLSRPMAPGGADQRGVF